MTRLIASLTLVAVVAGSLLMGCSPETTPTTPTTPTSPTTPTTPTSPSQPAAQTVRWNLQSSYSASSYLSETAIIFCDEISKVTGGQMQVTFFAAGGITPATEELDGTAANAIQMCLSAFGYNMDKWPHGVILDAKPGTMNHFAARMWWDSYGGIDFAKEMMGNHGTTPLYGPLVKTPEPFLSTNKPINSLADMRGLRVRAYGDAGEILGRLGCAVLYLPASEVYESMQRGVIDGFEMGTPAGDFQASTYEIIKYMYLGEVRSPYSLGPFFVNTNEWNKLPDHLRSAVQHTITSVTATWNGELVIRDLEAIEGFKANGVQILAIPRDVFDETSRQIDDMYAETRATDPFAARVLDSLADFETRFNESLSLHRSE